MWVSSQSDVGLRMSVLALWVVGVQLDRLILELRLTPLEAYWHLQRVLERLNAISSSLITNETFRLDETEDFADDLEKVGHRAASEREG